MIFFNSSFCIILNKACVLKCPDVFVSNQIILSYCPLIFGGKGMGGFFISMINMGLRRTLKDDR